MLYGLKSRVDLNQINQNFTARTIVPLASRCNVGKILGPRGTNGSKQSMAIRSVSVSNDSDGAVAFYEMLIEQLYSFYTPSYDSSLCTVASFLSVAFVAAAPWLLLLFCRYSVIIPAVDAATILNLTKYLLNVSSAVERTVSKKHLRIRY